MNKLKPSVSWLYADGWRYYVSFRRKKNPMTLRAVFHEKLEHISCEYGRLNGWNSTLQAAWYIRHVRWACLLYVSFIIWCLWTKSTIWSLILNFTILRKLVRACSLFDPHEGYRSVTPLDAARVNRTIFHNHSVHWFYITLIKGRDYIEQDIVGRHGKQNPHRER